MKMSKVERFVGWQSYINKKNLNGVLRSQPCTKPLSAAYDMVSTLLREGHLRGIAIFCTTGPCALGVMRALKDVPRFVGESTGPTSASAGVDRSRVNRFPQIITEVR